MSSLFPPDSGTVDFKEFLAMYAKRKRDTTSEEEEMKAAFKVMLFINCHCEKLLMMIEHRETIKTFFTLLLN